MNEMVERVMQAQFAEVVCWRLLESNGGEWIAQRLEPFGPPSAMPTLSQNPYTLLGRDPKKARETFGILVGAAAARKAIEAMREPTEAMLATGDSAIPQFAAEPGEARLMGRDGALDCWRAMIDEALKDHADANP